MQVESRIQPRAVLPNPQPGSLPPPATLPRPSHAFQPRTIEDFYTAVVPGTATRLTAPALHPNAALDFKGGESVALQRLKYYLWDSDLIATYFETRNGMLGGDFSTKFSPWLSHGCLSPRTVYKEIRSYEQRRTGNKSTYWVIFELTWRDFFRYVKCMHLTCRYILFRGACM